MKNKLWLIGAVLLGSTVAPAVASAQNIVTNPGFEDGDLGAEWVQFGNTGFTGLSGTFSGIPPHGGANQAYFGPVGSTGGITQTLATQAGRSYTISFWLYNFGGMENSASASFNGVTGYSVTNAPAFGYTNFSFTGTASGSSTDLSFTFRQDPSYFLLDDVSVVANAVPEPATWAMMLAGFGAVGFAMRRRSTVRTAVSFA